MVLTTTCSIHSTMAAGSGVIRMTIFRGDKQPDQRYIVQTNRGNPKIGRYLEDASLHLQDSREGRVCQQDKC